jgi:hypothetical protein
MTSRIVIHLIHGKVDHVEAAGTVSVLVVDHDVPGDGEVEPVMYDAFVDIMPVTVRATFARFNG